MPWCHSKTLPTTKINSIIIDRNQQDNCYMVTVLDLAKLYAYAIIAGMLHSHMNKNNHWLIVIGTYCP